MKTIHQERVEQFMTQAGQDVPPQPCVPSEDVRRLRAILILEEALETIKALGMDVMIEPSLSQMRPAVLHEAMYSIKPNLRRGADLLEIADGCADIKVVTTGTLSACGIADLGLQTEVDAANLRKFGPGSHRRDDGKWIKPADWQPPNIAQAIGLTQGDIL